MKKPSFKPRITLASVNALGQTIILCWLVYRVEGLHRQLHTISVLFGDITAVLSDQLMAAKIQFQMAIESILSLFGGSEG
jgi:hypothetical protein